MRISVYRGGAQRPSSLLWRRTMKKYLFALLPVVVAALVWFGLLSQSNRNTTATQAVEVVSVVSGKQWLTALFVALESIDQSDSLGGSVTSEVVDSSSSQSQSAEFKQEDTLVCEYQCEYTLELIRNPFPITDELYENALGNVDALASILRIDASLRSELINTAIHATANQSKLIIAAFTQLDFEHRKALGIMLSESPDRLQRFRGIELLSNTETMNPSLVLTFSELLQIESDPLIKSALISGLNRPDMNRGNAYVLDALTQLVHTDANLSVRGEALFATARLSNEPQGVLYDSVLAIRSHTGEYQQFGVRAIEEIVHRQNANRTELSYQSKIEMDQLMAELMSPEFAAVPADVRRQLDDLYERFF